MARLPGPMGLDEFSGQDFPSRLLGPDFGVDDITSGRGPIGWGRTCWFRVGRAAIDNWEQQQAERELDALRRLYGPIYNADANKVYFTWNNKKKQWVYDTDAYIKYRAGYFGSTADYESALEKAKEELDADKAALRVPIDPPTRLRRMHVDWQDAQNAFYAWTKKAYEKQRAATDTTEFAAVIKAQMSPTLKAKLDAVKKGYKTSFTAGGFNPRPQKIASGYRLGTLSEHAVGNAVDIEDANNPQIETGRWNSILAYTGKTWDHTALKKKWASKDSATAKGVYDALKGISDEWVSKLDKAVTASEAAAKKKAEEEAKKKAEEEAAKKKAAGADAKSAPAPAAAPAAKPAPPVDHLALVIAADKNLKTINGNDDWVKKWKGGFLNLDWDLVKELHAAGFAWGALFPNPDIHHFEL